MDQSSQTAKRSLDQALGLSPERAPVGTVQPAQFDSHQADYKGEAWRAYTLQELGMWVHLFAKRAEHRRDSFKRAKDINDARNYLSLMGAYLDAVERGESVREASNGADHRSLDARTS